MINKKLKIGDRVQFLDEVGGGEIVRMFKDGRFLIKDDDGFEETYEIQQLLVPISEDDEPVKKIIEPPIVKQILNSIRKEFLGIKLGDAIRPIDDVGEGQVKSISEEGVFTVRMIDGLDMEYQRNEIVEILLEQEKKLEDSISDSSSLLKDEDKIKIKKTLKVKREISLWEVDLHVHEITEETDKLSPAELLQIQMDHFEIKLKEAISQKVRKIIFIHGRGKGKLKAEIRARLKRYPNCEFLDGNYQRYGQGATEVIIWNV
ncbi:MAG: hypothetical protein ACI8XB_000556 [Patiriisocius sp.]|jgi:hypothetical protein